MQDTQSSDHKLRIAIDCRIDDFRQGVGTAVQVLAKTLSNSSTMDQEYTFIVLESMRDELAPYVYGPCTLECVPTSRLSSLKSALRRITPLRFLRKKLRRGTAQVPKSNGYVESRNFDLIHFPTQVAYRTNLPTIYQPWDLQHLHYPQFFPNEDFAHRERCYRAFCDQAFFVCVQAEWTRQDVILQYGIAKEKVVVIPWGSVFDAYTEPSERERRAAVEKYNLPSRFFFYPAVTWPHKNHEIILNALCSLKKTDGLAPHVFFTGASTDYRSTLDKIAQDLGVAAQVHFLGFVTPTELQTIFISATAMIFPSRFEGFGLPILEAFHARLPVLASNATTLPEVAQDGALYFDPDSPDELAMLMREVLESQERRRELIEKGSHVLSQHSITKTAAGFQALYEATAALARNDRRPSANSGSE